MKWKRKKFIKIIWRGCHQKIGVTYEIIDSSYLLTIKGETEEGEEISQRELQKDYEIILNLLMKRTIFL